MLCLNDITTELAGPVIGFNEQIDHIANTGRQTLGIFTQPRAVFYHARHSAAAERAQTAMAYERRQETRVAHLVVDRARRVFGKIGGDLE